MMTATDANKELVTQFFATFSSGDLPALLDSMTDDCNWVVMGRLEGMSGRYDKAAFGPLLAGARSLYKSGTLEIRPVSMIAEGCKVAVEAQGHAELNDGRVYRPQYHFLVELRGGKVSEVREYMDTLHAKETFFDQAPA